MHFFLTSIFVFLLAFHEAAPFSAHIPHSETIKAVHYQANSRGSAESIRITPDSVVVEKSGRMGPYKRSAAISEKEWQKVVESLQGVELSKIPQLKAPSDLRQRDAAMHAKLSITTDKTSYTSSSFDDRKPPKPLLALMKVIDQLSAEQE